MIELIQDNGGKSIRIHEINLIAHIKRYFKWRKNVTVKRLQANTSSTEYDAFIEHLLYITK
jgi:hypothetical protein